MMRKIGYLLQPEFEGIEFVVGADHSCKWRILHLQSQVHPRKRTRVTARKSVPLLKEQQRFVVEIPEEIGECTAVALATVLASMPQRDQPMGEDNEEPMEEEFFEESRTEWPLIGYTPAP
ncbi:hypothetical protein GUJ93_ZPchr0128g33461 [Zizania palustris]|uniref:Uncharacterized protein n=1 Tax=Zizania palustris TaxID=103762 RepID=A0A8J5R2X3_ZIZPA|nr:hypothetical protein GUJ93_ZPchr0128g33461 [Zizania palustris]